MTTILDRPTDISLDIDLSLLVGEMEDMACEHSQHNHGTEMHDDGPATHYIKGLHHCFQQKVYAACSLFSQYVENDSMTIICRSCMTVDRAREMLQVVGKVGG